MSDFNWKNIDLNLLVAFQALMEAGSVTRAAEKSYVSQSAMSHSLQRLRVLLDDPLFERVGSRMEPTPRALELSKVVDSLLLTVKTELLEPKQFNPEEYKGLWRIGLTDYAEQAFGPILFDLIKQIAPNAKVVFFNVNKSNYQSQFEEHKLDVVIGSFGQTSSKYRVQQLYTEKHLCLFDNRQLEFELPLSEIDFVSVEHALVSPVGAVATQVDAQLEELGLKRDVSFVSSNFLTIRKLVRGRRLMCIVPRLVAITAEGEDKDLVACEPPIDVPDFNIHLVYRANKEKDEKNSFLRGNIQEAVLSVIGSDEPLN
ncbi:LysR family transcriptional regulator [Vibrio maerlii]|uniref:LysR family transcriptional regulator n=1 Tax=Vibrio maerlii TaxID=2231648 RepID=UPI000E3DA4D2|nr:LysR family transcriptional regulator [Vibrio maerlii]